MKFFDMNMSSEHESDDVLAMAFVNVQQLNSLYDAENGFCKGTLFPCLYKPLEVAGGMMR